MAQYFGQTQGMSIAQPTNYLDVIRQKKAEEEKKKSLIKKEEKFNLYDFSKVQKPTLNFGPGVSQVGVTNVNQYNPVTKKTENIFTKPTMPTTQKSGGFSLIPKASANTSIEFTQADIDNFKDLVSKGVEPSKAKELIIVAKKYTPEQIASAEKFGQGLQSIIGKRTEDFKNAKGEFMLPTALGFMPEKRIQQVGAVYGSLQDIAGLTIGEGLKQLYNKSPEVIKEKVKEVAGKEMVQDALKAIQVGGIVWEDFAQKNPRLAKDLAGLQSITEMAGTVGVTPKTLIEKPVKILGKSVEKTGETLVKGGEKILKQTGKVKKIITPTTRNTEDISANILQPYKGMTENLADANKGLQRVIQETGTKVDDFEVLAKNTSTTKEKYGKILDESLGNVNGEKFSESADTALAQLGELYKGTQSQASKNILKRINKLGIKNQQSGLTAREMQEVKVLHTKANNLFNEKGQATGGFLADDLRSVRNELKTDIEDFASSQGITNIKDINQVYGELLDTESLLKNQIANVKAFKGRALPTTTWEKIGSLIGKIPVIKGGVQGIFKEAGLSLKAGKIDPLEVQKRLPKLLEELKKAGVKEGELKTIETKIRTFITPPPKPRLLLPPGKTTLKPNQPTNVSHKPNLGATGFTGIKIPGKTSMKNIEKLDSLEMLDKTTDYRIKIPELIEKIKKGNYDPIIVTKNKNGNFDVIDGNHRLATLKYLGINKVKTVEVNKEQALEIMKQISNIQNTEKRLK